ncbi:4009_t:CDS:2 [Rhizophagus irregularis]|nr:4009_t:CDS:2 [Rhizophagus irregularis]
MVQSTHDGTFQNAIDRAKRCKMTLMAGKNKNRTRSPGHISRTCPQRNNNRSGNGGIAATVLNQQSQQPQLAQSTQPLNANSTNNLNSNSNDLIALLVQQLLAQKGANSTI